MLLNLVLLASGCVLLYFGADWLVRGASTIAAALGIPKSVVGLTLVALGTSAPEMFVNVLAGYNGKTGFALSNVSGSNLTNICIGFGLCGVLGGVVVKWRAFRVDCLVMILSAAMLLVILLLNPLEPLVPVWALIPMLSVLALYLLSLARRGGAGTEDDEVSVSGGQLAINIALFVLGVSCLYGGGQMVLTSAVDIAETFAIDPALIGLTIVAAGTSVPDTIASVIAARRGEHEIAVGNLLGSNISNVLVVLSGTILASWLGGKPEANPGVLLASKAIVLDYAMVSVVSVLFVVLAVLRNQVRRQSGIALMFIFFTYMAYRVVTELSGSGL